MKHTAKHTAFAAAAIAAFGAVEAQAAVAFYTDRSVFEAAVEAAGLASATETFDDFSDTPETTPGRLPDFSVGEITFSGVDAGLTTRLVGDPQVEAGITGDTIVYSGVQDGALTGVLGNQFFRADSVTGPLYGIGFDLAVTEIFTGRMRLWPTSDFEDLFGAPTFAGFLFSEPGEFNYFSTELHSDGSVRSYDNMTVAYAASAPSTIPVPAALPLALAAFGSLVAVSRVGRRRHG